MAFRFRCSPSAPACRLAAIEKSALAARREGLLEIADGFMRPTPHGRRFLNRLLAGFL
jgi:hypothetical protein